MGGDAAASVVVRATTAATAVSSGDELVAESLTTIEGTNEAAYQPPEEAQHDGAVVDGLSPPTAASDDFPRAEVDVIGGAVAVARRYEVLDTADMTASAAPTEKMHQPLSSGGGGGGGGGTTALPSTIPLASAGVSAGPPPPPPPSVLLSAMAQLPAEVRRRLISALPPGWRPGDPLPADLPDIRALLMQAGRG